MRRNLSPLRARVTHLELWHGGVVCFFNLPPSLGVLRLTGRVVWTRRRSTEQTLAGDRWDNDYETGIEFTNLTPEHKKALAAALATLQAVQATADREPSACAPPSYPRPRQGSRGSGFRCSRMRTAGWRLWETSVLLLIPAR